MTTVPSLPLLGEEPTVVPGGPDDRRLWSVTTLIGVLDKPALVPWTAIKTAEAAVDQQDVWMSRYEREGRDAAIEWLKKARFRRVGGRSATELGTAVHKACEHKAIYGEWLIEDYRDTELRPFLAQFDKFLADYGPEYLAAEVTVFAPEWGYAGTCDGIMRIGDHLVMVDYKTTTEDYTAGGKLKTPYPEVGLQLAAYRYAELAAVWRARQAEQFKRRYYLLSDTERALGVPVPEVAGGVAILLTPTRYAVHPVRCDRVVHDYFLHLLDVAQYVMEIAPAVVGAPMVAPAGSVDPTDPFQGIPR